jgi:AraC-like DNA-binding protein
LNNNIFIPPTASLRNSIRSIWQVAGFTPFQKENILPKGVIEIIFNFSESSPLDAQIDHQQFQLARCFINGYNTYPIQLELPKQQVFFGVQFHPVAVRHFLGVPASEFTNVAIDLTLLDRFFNSLWHQLAEKKTFNERVTVITKWIESKIIDVSSQEQLLNFFLENDHLHNLSVTNLSKILCYSTRHLSRKIYELTKMNTEKILLYKKYLHSVHLIHHTNLSLTAIAYRSNFADQSHFIKSFKSFAQITPGEYRQNKSFVEGHIFKNVR